MSDAITRATGLEKPRVAVVLGSGLSALAGSLLHEAPIPYSKIEGMPVSTVVGHEGALYHGEVSGVGTLIFAGRVHLYEGFDASVVTHWVRAAAAAGCDTFVVTNAAGAVNPGLRIGAPCLITDHINLTGVNPLVGPNDDSVGPRFLDLTEVYSRELRAQARATDSKLEEGVYAGLLGPTYESPAEVRMLQVLGADLVGMSTVLEAIMARYLGARVLGISVVSNLAAGLSPTPLNHEEVTAAGKLAAARLEPILRGVISSVGES